MIWPALGLFKLKTSCNAVSATPGFRKPARASAFTASVCVALKRPAWQEGENAKVLLDDNTAWQGIRHTSHADMERMVVKGSPVRRCRGNLRMMESSCAWKPMSSSRSASSSTKTSTAMSQGKVVLLHLLLHVVGSGPANTTIKNPNYTCPEINGCTALHNIIQTARSANQHVSSQFMERADIC